MKRILVLAIVPVASAFLHIQGKQSNQQCLADDMQQRTRMQNYLAGVCEDICKATGAYPKCSGCSNFVMPDSTPGVMTWPEMFTRMDDLVDWGRDQLKQMRKMQSMALPQTNHNATTPTGVEPHSAPAVPTEPRSVTSASTVPSKAATPPS